MIYLHSLWNNKEYTATISTTRYSFYLHKICTTTFICFFFNVLTYFLVGLGRIFFLPDAGYPAGLSVMPCRIFPDIRLFCRITEYPAQLYFLYMICLLFTFSALGILLRNKPISYLFNFLPVRLSNTLDA